MTPPFVGEGLDPSCRPGPAPRSRLDEPPSPTVHGSGCRRGGAGDLRRPRLCRQQTLHLQRACQRPSVDHHLVGNPHYGGVVCGLPHHPADASRRCITRGATKVDRARRPPLGSWPSRPPGQPRPTRWSPTPTSCRLLPRGCAGPWSSRRRLAPHCGPGRCRRVRPRSSPPPGRPQSSWAHRSVTVTVDKVPVVLPVPFRTPFEAIFQPAASAAPTTSTTSDHGHQHEHRPRRLDRLKRSGCPG